MSSDNLIVRREARRRKILENSENRLKRITGKSESTEKTENVQHEENGFMSISNDIIPNGTTIKSQKETTPHVPARQWSEDDSYAESSISEQFDFLSSTSGIVENDANPSIKNVASYVPSNIIYISLAILFRFSIELSDHVLWTNSLVVVFLLTKLAVCSFYGLPIPETSRFLGSLLLLSGISTQKIKIFTISMSIVYSVLYEFALCIFVFVFSDLIVNTYKAISQQ